MSGLYCADVHGSFVQGEYSRCQRGPGLGLDHALGHNTPTQVKLQDRPKQARCSVCPVADDIYNTQTVRYNDCTMQ